MSKHSNTGNISNMSKQLISLELESTEVVAVWLALIAQRKELETVAYNITSAPEREATFKQVQELRELITKVQKHIITEPNTN